jgi:hypothetical protein
VTDGLEDFGAAEVWNEQTEDTTGRNRTAEHVGTGTSAPRHKTQDLKFVYGFATVMREVL